MPFVKGILGRHVDVTWLPWLSIDLLYLCIVFRFAMTFGLLHGIWQLRIVFFSALLEAFNVCKL